MQQSDYNLRGRSRSQTSLASFRSLSLALLLVFLSMVKPQTVVGASTSLENIPAMMRLMQVIAAVNYSMREASANPMDDSRRRNVQLAIGMMPAAIVGLAQVFQEGQLKDADLPAVQKILGGFVDVNAADTYQKFLKNPRADLIPHTGPGFPKITPAALPSAATIAKAGNSPTSSTASGKTVSNKTVTSEQLVSLGGSGYSYQGDATKSTGNLQAASSGSASASGYTYQSDATKSVGADGGSASLGNGDSSSVASTGSSDGIGNSLPVDSGFLKSLGLSSNQVAAIAVPQTAYLKQANSELSNIEAGINGANTNSDAMPADLGPSYAAPGAAPSDASNTESADGLKKTDRKVKSDRLEKRRAQALGTVRPVRSPASSDNYQFSAKPQYWKVQPILHLAGLFLLSQPARAEEGGGGGQQASQVLFALAVMMQGLASAIAPVLIAENNNQTDLAITQQNNATQIALTQITAQNSQNLAKLQASVALQQSAIAQQINSTNQQYQSDRLNSQLAQLQAARQDALQSQREQRAIEYNFNQERIGLAQQQAQDNVNLAKQTLAANLTAAGLSQGYSTSTNTAAKLSVSQTTLGAGGPLIAGNSAAGTQLASAGTAASGVSGLVGGANSAVDPGTSAAAGAGAGTGAVGLKASVPERFSSIQPTRSQALLDAVKPSLAAQQLPGVSGVRTGSNGLAASYGVIGAPASSRGFSYLSKAGGTLPMPPALKRMQANSPASGSTVDKRWRVAGATVASGTNGNTFGRFYNSLKAREADAVVGSQAQYAKWQAGNAGDPFKGNTELFGNSGGAQTAPSLGHSGSAPSLSGLRAAGHR